MDTIVIGECKCGSYGQVFDAKTEVELGTCHRELDEERYWVGSNDAGEPEKIYFNRADALDGNHDYLDSFDSYGKWLFSYKLEDGADKYVRF